MPSPIQVVHQFVQKLLHLAIPKIHPLTLPRVATTIVEMTAAASNAITSRRRSRRGEKPMRSSSIFPAIAWRVTLKALVAIVGQGILIPPVEFNKKEPIATPGHIWKPLNKNAAKAIPAGGHTGEASAFASPNIDADSFPVKK